MKQLFNKFKVSFSVILSVVLCVFVVGSFTGAFDLEYSDFNFKDITPEEFNQLNSQFLGFESHDGVEVHEGATDFADNILPITDNTYNLGSATKEWKDLYIDGTAHIDTLSSGAISTAGDLNPSANNTHDIGQYDSAWKDIYASGTITVAGDGTSTSTFLGLGVGDGVDSSLGLVVVKPTIHSDGIVITETDSDNVAIKFAGTATTGNIFVNIGGATSHWIAGAGPVIFNESGSNLIDVRIESVSEQGMFFLDAGTDKIGIATQYPSEMLTVYGGNLAIGDGSATTTVASDFIRLNSDNTNASGTFYVDNAGNMSASGTLTIAGSGTSTFNGLEINNPNSFSATQNMGGIDWKADNTFVASLTVETTNNEEDGHFIFSSILQGGSLEKIFKISSNGKIEIFDPDGNSFTELSPYTINFNRNVTTYRSGKFAVNSSGNISTSGTLRVHNLTNSTNSNSVCYNATTKELTYNSGDGCSSGQDMKENIQTLELDIEKVMSLEPKSFTLKDGGAKSIGLVAEEVVDILPEITTYYENGELSGVDYSKLSTALLLVIQDQEKRITELENKMGLFEKFLNLFR